MDEEGLVMMMRPQMLEAVCNLHNPLDWVGMCVCLCVYAHSMDMLWCTYITFKKKI